MAPKIAIKVSRKFAPIQCQSLFWARKNGARAMEQPSPNKKTPGAQWHPGVISAAQTRAGGFGELHRPSIVLLQGILFPRGRVRNSFSRHSGPIFWSAAA